MIYQCTHREQPYHVREEHIPRDKPLWAVAYNVNDDTKHNRLRCKPTLGEIHYSMFRPYKKSKQGEVCDSGAVSIYARYFADTYREAVTVWNMLIEKRIEKLNQYISEARAEMIQLTEDSCNDKKST